MTKADIVNDIVEKTGQERSDVQYTIEAFLKVVKESMKDGENIYLRGFGSFINKKRNKKLARDLSKNTAIIIEEHYIPAFKPAKIFIESIKNSSKVKTANQKK